MSNYYDRERLWSLIIVAIDNLEQVARARELINILWEINAHSDKTEQDWSRVEILLESYEQKRDRSLETALSNLRELVQIMTNPI